MAAGLTACGDADGDDTGRTDEGETTEPAVSSTTTSPPESSTSSSSVPAETTTVPGVEDPYVLTFFGLPEGTEVTPNPPFFGTDRQISSTKATLPGGGSITATLTDSPSAYADHVAAQAAGDSVSGTPYDTVTVGAGYTALHTEAEVDGVLYVVYRWMAGNASTEIQVTGMGVDPAVVLDAGTRLQVVWRGR